MIDKIKELGIALSFGIGAYLISYLPFFVFEMLLEAGWWLNLGYEFNQTPLLFYGGLIPFLVGSYTAGYKSKRSFGFLCGALVVAIIMVFSYVFDWAMFPIPPRTGFQGGPFSNDRIYSSLFLIFAGDVFGFFGSRVGHWKERARGKS